MRRLRDVVETTWSSEGRLAPVLAALSAPYAAGVTLRNRAYDRGWLTARRIPARVVSVGNIVVGGTGKTPLTLWLATRLVARGRRAAIVARGYGKRRRGVVVVGDGARIRVSAADGGDEAVLMARRFGGPVVTGEDRVAAARVAALDLGADVIVLDDGFQHRRLARDVDVVLDVAAGPERLLPAGPYREPRSSITRASGVVVVGDEPRADLPVDLPVFRADIRAETLVWSVRDVWTTASLAELAGRPVVAVAGIARPERFFRSLEGLGATVVRTVVRPDHHRWGTAEVEAVIRDAGGSLVVTTEKDLVKWRLEDGAPVRALRIGLTVDRGEELLDLVLGTGVLCG